MRSFPVMTFKCHSKKSQNVTQDHRQCHNSLDRLHRLSITDRKIRLHLFSDKISEISLNVEVMLPRDAMHSADYAVARYVCQPVRASARPSVTRLYSIEMAKPIIKHFSPSGRHTTVDFHATKRSPANRGVEYRVYRKIAIFSQYLALSRN